MFKTMGITPHFLIVVRSPYEVYRSLERRDGFTQEKSYMLWAIHYLEAVRYTTGFPRTFMAFDRFLENPVRALLHVEKNLALNFPISVEAAADEIRTFVSKDLRHQTSEGRQDLKSPLNDLVCGLEKWLNRAADCVENSPVEFDAYVAEMEGLQRGFNPVLVEQIRMKTLEAGKLNLLVTRILSSWSWFLGKPIRALERFVGRDI